MTVREVLSADSPILRQKAKRVKIGASIRALVEDMVETMHATNGVGLAAPQMGVPLRVFVAQLPEDHEDPLAGQLLVFFNPEIVKSSGEEEEEEGCLCLPGYVGDVARATEITIKGQDQWGKRRRLHARGFLARVLQHEIDHLNGMLYVDHLKSPEDLRRLPPPEEAQISEQTTSPQ